MKQFLLILFLGKSILLTSLPIDITSNWLEVNLEKPLSAITGGASLRIHIPVDDKRLLALNKKDDIFHQLGMAFPSGKIEAELFESNGQSIRLNHRDFSISDFTFTKDDSLFIVLSPESTIPINVEYTRLRIKSEIPLTGVELSWKNFKH